jgi:YHS domain-containing protein
MDVFARTGKRAWLVGAAAAGMLTPALLSGQANRPAPTNAPSAGVQPAESAVEQQLRQLYERDGREMPNIRLTPSPAAQQMANQPAANSVRPRYSSAPPAVPPQKSPNKVTSFFKKLIPAGSKGPTAQAVPHPPRQLPPAPPQPAAISSSPPIARQPTAQGQPAPVRVSVPPTSAPPFTDQLLDNLTTENAEEPVPLPAPTRDNALMADDEDLDLDDEEEATFETPIQVESSPVEAASPRLDDDFPDPFQGAGENEFAEEDVEMNPFTGRALDEDGSNAPATLPAGPEIRPVTSSVDPTVDESTAAKMRRVIQRTDMKGLKGFCPVTLRDQRELADSRPEFVASYRGQKFYFASKAAQAKFESDPARYAPAAYGADVVVLVNDQDVVEGTLEYAAWYKGRLYLFGSQETHDAFIAQPERYASPPGIE